MNSNGASVSVFSTPVIISNNEYHYLSYHLLILT